MLRTLSIAAALAAGVTAFVAHSATAQNVDTIKARKEILKGMGAAAKDPGAMVKGEAKFDLAKVKAALKSYQEGAAKLPNLFPDDSKTGGDTEALPEIWAKKKDFLDRFPKLAADSKAAETAITDEATFKAGWPKLMGDNCGACHKIYRKPK